MLRLRNCLCLLIANRIPYFKRSKQTFIVAVFLIEIHKVKVFDENNLIILVIVSIYIYIYNMWRHFVDRSQMQAIDCIASRYLCKTCKCARAHSCIGVCVFCASVSMAQPMECFAVTIKRSVVRSITPFFNVPLSIMSFIIRLNSLQSLNNLYICR